MESMYIYRTHIPNRIIFVAIFAFAGCTKSPREQKAPPAPPIKETRVILHGENALNLLNQCSRRTPSPHEGVWEPSEKEIERLEKLLPVFLATTTDRLKRNRLNGLNKHKVQYAGIIKNKHRVIYANFFPASNAQLIAKWTTEPVIVCDGGNDFWGIEFDVATESFSNLEINGDA